jgi:chitinase
MVSLGGWNDGSAKFSKLSADPELRTRFKHNAIDFLRKYSFDGLDLDWLFPGFREGSRVEDKENYALLIKVQTES